MEGRSDARPDQPRWTDHDLAVLIELAYSTGWHRHRHGLPESDDRLTFAARCRRRLAWLRGCRPEAPPGQIWAGIEQPDPVDLYRSLPTELRHLRRPRGDAA